MKFAHLLVIIFLLLSKADVFAAEVVGLGWGDTEAAAKREALLDISSRISVTVRSKFKSTQSVKSQTVAGKKTETVNLSAENTIETNSELPILGADFIYKKDGAQLSAKAVLESSKSLPLYESRLAELRSRMAALNASIAKAQTTEAQYNAIMDIFTLLDEFKKINTVSIYLGGKQQDPGVAEDALHNQVRTVTKQVDSLDLAAKLLTKGVTESGVYIFPTKARNSNEITPFASLIKDKLSVHIKSSLNPRDAAYTFIGEYEESANGIAITYHLLDNTSVAQKTNTVQLSKQAYAGLQTTPKTTDFEKLLSAGVAVSGDLRANISTNLGVRDLLFAEGDEVELFVKMSEMGYFYVVGHTVKESESNSYLLEISETQGARKFVRFVNADDANKWIGIGKFQVAAPFGVEGLQMVASSKDLIDSLPSTKLDSASGLHIVSAAPKEGVLKTRALIKKFSKTAQTSEASLIFTTKAK